VGIFLAVIPGGVKGFMLAPEDGDFFEIPMSTEAADAPMGQQARFAEINLKNHAAYQNISVYV